MYQSILITGISSGLGHGLAAYYLGQGKEVYALNRKMPEDLAHFNNLHFLSCDLTDETAVVSSINTLLSDIEQLDLVVLNAGILNKIKNLQDTPLTEIRQVMEVNTWANKLVIDTLVSTQIKIRQIVAISSGAAISGNQGWNAYGLSKAALNMLIKLYAGELPEIHFSALAPGLVDTAMQDYICSLSDNSEFEVVDRLKACRGTKLMPKPEELAPQLDKAFTILAKLKSGEFSDIRQFDL